MTASTWLHVVVITLALVLPDYAGAQTATRTVTDMARAVTLPVQIRKVATIGSVPVINSLMFAMGAGDMIVNGLPEPFARQQRWKYQTVFALPWPTSRRCRPDRAPDIEALLTVEPDVVFTMDKPNLDVLQRHNLPVVFLAWREPGDVKVAMQLLRKFTSR